MKICIWSPLYPPDVGGIEFCMQRLARDLIKRGHQVLVMAGQGTQISPELTTDGHIEIRKYEIRQALESHDIRALHRIQRSIREEVDQFQPELDHLAFGGPVPMSFVYLRTPSLNRPLVLSTHGSMRGLNSGSTTMLRRMTDRAQKIIACSQSAEQSLLASVPDCGPKSLFLYETLDRSKLPISPFPDTPCLLFLGRLVRDKGPDIAIEAFRSIHATYPSTKLIIAGDGPERNALEKQIQGLGLQDSVQFIGEITQQQVPHIIDSATMLLVPSRYEEAFGVVAVEAAQRKRPVIGSDTFGLAEAIRDGETGILVPMEDSESLATAVKKVLATPELGQRLGEQGYHQWQIVNTREKYLNQLIDIYEGCLSRS